MNKKLLFITTFIISLLFTQNIAAQTSHNINAGNFYYNPDSITINVGDTVNWINDGGFHNVNFGINTLSNPPITFGNPAFFTSVPTAATNIYTYVFTIPGNYQYDCSVGAHAANGMVGQLIVNASSLPSISVTTTDPDCTGDNGIIDVDLVQSVPPSTVRVLIKKLNSGGSWITLSTQNSWAQNFYTTNLQNFVNDFGQYKIELVDSASNTVIQDTLITLTDPSPVVVSLQSSQDPSTPISNDGAINISVAGGTVSSSYTFNWSNGVTTEDISNISAGAYTVIATDDNGCSDTASFSISAISNCGYDTSTVNVSCFSALDGQIHVSNIYGLFPYTLSLKDTTLNNLNLDTLICNTCLGSSDTSHVFVGGAGSGFNYGIGKGEYELILTDASGCSKTTYISIDRVGQPFIIGDTTISLITDTINPNGYFTLSNISGGTGGPYNFTWYDANGNLLQNSTSSTLDSLDVGTYSVVITDNSGCNSGIVSPITGLATIVFQMNLAPGCYKDSVLVHNICPGASQGEAMFILGDAWTSYNLYTDTFGTPILGYSNPASVTNITGLATGIYNLMLSSTINCFDSIMTFEILEPVINNIEITNAIAGSGNMLCQDDSSRVLIDISNLDTSYSYLYRVDYNGTPLGQADFIQDTSSHYYQAETNNYELVLLYSPSNSCQNESGYTPYPFTIGEYMLKIDSVNITDEICGFSLGEITIHISADNSPFTYSLLDLLGDTVYSDNSNVTSFPFPLIPADTLLVSVEDDKQCATTWYTPVVVSEIVSINLDSLKIIEKETCNENDGYLQIVPLFGQGDYDFILVNTSNDSIFKFDTDTFTVDTLDEGIYFLSVIDDSSCVKLDTIIIEHVIPFEISSLNKVVETCCGDDGSLDLNITPGDGTALLYTLRFDTSAINALNLPLASVDELYINTFNLTQNTSLFTNLKRGYYHLYVEDEFGCVDSVDYVAYHQGLSAINTYLGIDASISLDMSVSTTNIICYGDTNATVKLLYPNACYNYQLLYYVDSTAGVVISTDSMSVFDTLIYYDNLYAGIYGIKGLSNSNYAGCVRKSDTFEILEPSVVSYDSPISSPAFCLNGGFAIDSGACNGMLWLPNTPTGGVTDTSIIQGDTLYQYYINRINSSIPYFQGPILTDSSFTGLCPGEYEVQVFDGNNCMVKDTVEVMDHSLYIDSILTTDISCFDSSNATISVYAHGGIGDYYYVWTDSIGAAFSDTTYILDSLYAGEYSVTIYDSANCYASTSAIVMPAPEELIIIDRVTYFDTEETCLGYSYNGSIGFEIRGGTGPYIYEWFNSNDTSITGIDTSLSVYCYNCFSSYDGAIIDSVFMLNGLTADVYQITFTDINGCASEINLLPVDSFRILAANRNNPLIIDSIIGWQDVLCYGSVSDSIVFSVNASAMGPLTFILDSSSTVTNDSLVNYTGVFTSLGTNDYDVIITDSFGCFIDTFFTINQYSEIIISSIVQNVSCFEGNNGAISTQVSGGISPYSYQWETGEFTSDINDLTARTYSVTVTDTFGCTSADSIYVSEPSPIQSIVTNKKDALCNGGASASGLINVTDLTGTPPYSYSWVNISDPLIVIDNDSLLSDINAGVYLCTITDVNGCEDTIRLSLNEPTKVILEIADTIHNLCAGESNGEIVVIASGGTPPYHDYTIKGSNIYPPQLSNVFSNLSEDQYFIWVSDDNNCLSDTIDQKIRAPGLLEILDSLVTDLSCYESNDGVIIYDINGGKSIYSYELFHDGSLEEDGFIFQQSGFLKLNYLDEGEYYLEVVDANGCDDNISISISQPEEVISEFSISENLIFKNNTVTVTNLSTGANIYTWNFGDGSGDIVVNESNHKYTQQGSFEIRLIANNSDLNNSCNDTSFINIDVEGYDIYNVFTPNGDGINDTYQFSDEMLLSLNVSIYNRWGQQVYEINDVNGVWDGRGYNGELLPDGVYFFVMEAVGELGISHVEEGTITLIIK
jgi:gliding motility-associated-like protein